MPILRILSKRWYLVNLFLSVFLILSWFRDRKILAGGEEGLLFYEPQRILNIYTHTWYETGTGYPMPVILPRITYLSIVSLLDLFVSSWITQAVIFFIILSVGLVGMYLLSQEFFQKDFISFVSSLFYLFNLYTQSQVWNRFITAGMFGWAFIPFFLFLFVKWIGTFKKKWVLISTISLLFFSNTFGQPSNVITLLAPVFVFIVLTFISGKKAEIRYKEMGGFLAFFLFFITVNIWWIYPLTTLGESSFSEVSGFNENYDTLRGTSIYFPTREILFLRQRFLFGSSSHWYFFYASYISKIVSLIIFFIVSVGILASRTQKSWRFFIYLFIVGWFVSKGSNPPFGDIFFKFLFSVFPISTVLRNSWEKFGLVFVLPYSIFFALGVNFIYQKLKPKIREVAVGVILFLSCGVLVWPMWTGAVYTKDVHVRVPLYYEEANEFLNSFDGSGRILMLPMIAGDGVKMSWDYGGIEPSEFLFDKPAISKILRTKYFDDVYWYLREKLNKQKKLDSRDLRNLDVTFLILRKDLLQGLDSGDLGVNEVRNMILANRDIRHLKDFGDLEIYLFEPNKNGSLFEVLDGEGIKISYHRFSPTKYKVFVKNVDKPFTLVFKNTYYDFWIARINEEEIKDHFLVYNYANAWKIEKTGDYTIDVVFKIWPWE